MIRYLGILFLTYCSYACSAKETIIYDLDGTLTNADVRVAKFIINRARKDVDWDGFSLASVDDLPMNESIEQLRKDYAAGYRIEIWTGRGSIAREITIKWLKDHEVPYHKLNMKTSGDGTATHLVKSEWYRSFVKEHGKTIIRVYDDTECNWKAFPDVADIRIPIDGRLRPINKTKCGAE